MGNSIFGSKAAVRIEKLGGIELLQKMDSVDHKETRLLLNPWLRDNQGLVQQQKEAAELWQSERALKEVMSKMKVEDREKAKAGALHSFNDRFEQSQPVEASLERAKVPPFKAASASWLA